MVSPPCGAYRDIAIATSRTPPCPSTTCTSLLVQPRIRSCNFYSPCGAAHPFIMPQELLIDVRSPLEFSTGPLISDIAPTINIEYTQIDSLPEIYAAQNITVEKDDSITLYCRSGRRSDIAKRRLEELGFMRVRDIGGFEDARRVLDREQVERQLEGMAGDGKPVVVEQKESDGKENVRKESLNALLAGLKECDE